MKIARLILILVALMLLPSTSRAVQIISGGPVGIDIYPACTLDINAFSPWNPAFTLRKDGSLTNYFSLKDYGTIGQTEINSVHSSGGVQIEFNPMPMDHTGAAYFKFFRQTNTTGQVALEFNRGDGSATVDSRIGVHGLSTFFTNTRVGIGTNAPSASYLLDVAGATRVSGTLTTTGEATVPVINITGGSDVSEQFDIKAKTGKVEPGMVVAIDPARAGELIVSTKAYDRTVAGVISGAGGVKPGMVMGQSETLAYGRYPVALTGRVYVKVDATKNAVVPGDMLTTSNTPGHAMKVTDHVKAQGAIIGKAMTALPKGKGLVLVLVTLQ